MKTLLCLFALVLTARAEISAQARLETYYLDPHPADVPRLVRELGHDGYFERAENVAVAIGFLGTVLARQPERVEDWLLQLNGVPAKEARVIASALWQAGHPLGPELLRILGERSPLRAEVERVANLPVMPLLETPVQSPSSMRLHWGAFLASGDERHIVRILDAFALETPGLTSAVRMALAQNAADHPRVLEICRAQLERQPEEIRGELRAALQAVDRATMPRS